MLTKLIFVFALLSTVRDLLAAGSEEYYGSIGRLEQCPGSEGLRVKVHQMYMNYKGNHMYTITFNMSLEEDVDRPLDMKFEVRKCANEHGPCEDFVSHTIEDVCSELQVVGSIPHTLFDMAKLPTKCPLKKGFYIADKTQIKIHQELLELGKYGNYWKFKVLLLKNPDNPIFCLYVEGKVAKVTKMKRKKKGH